MEDALRRRAWTLVTTLSLLAVAPRARAQTPTDGAPAAPPRAPGPAPVASPPSSAPAGPSEAAVAEAKERYRRALELFDEGSFDAAQLEMRRAYALAPSYRMLYNLGLISVQLNDYVAALDFFQRYLSEGGKEVPADRASDVEQRIDRLRGRIGFLRVETNVPAQITVDDVVVGRTPLDKPIRVNAGKRRVAAQAEGLVPDSRAVEVAGGEQASLTLSLVDPRVATAKHYREAPRPEMWIAWGATALLGGTTAVLGVIAIGANDDYKTRQNTFGVTSGELVDADHKARGLSLAADLFGAATILSAGTAIYFTVRPKDDVQLGPSEPKREARGFFVRPAPSRIQVGTTF